MKLEPYLREILETATKKTHDSIKYIIEYILDETHTDENIQKVVGQLKHMAQRETELALSARSLLALCYYHGIGLKTDITQAKALLENAANSCPLAQFTLAFHYFKEEGPVSQKAVELAKKAREGNFSPSFTPAYIATRKKQEEYPSAPEPEGYEPYLDPIFSDIVR